MMTDKDQNTQHSLLLSIIIWGTLWGIFEATVGYFLHLVSFPYSFIIMYPFACFFMANVYRITSRTSSIFYIGLICASTKMLNLFLPIRIDKVINPAVSIVFEAASMALTVFVFDSVLKEKKKTGVIKALLAIITNTGWRILYVLYLLFLVPDFIRNVSVISSTAKFIEFFITQNLITTAIIYILYSFKDTILKPVAITEKRISIWFNAIPKKTVSIFKATFALFMLCADVGLQILLK